MNKNKVLLMYFTVLMWVLRAGPDHDLSSGSSDSSDTESAGDPGSIRELEGHLKKLREIELAKSELVKQQDTTNDELLEDLIQKLGYLNDLQKYVEGEMAQSMNPKPKKPKPIKNLKECWADYFKLSQLGTDDLQENLPEYKEKFNSLVAFMNNELKGIKKALKGICSQNPDLKEDALRQKFSTIHKMYIMHLKVYTKLQPFITEGKLSTYEDLIQLPHRAPHDGWAKTVGYLYAIYTELETICTTNKRILKIKQGRLKSEWDRYIRPLFPNSGIGPNGRFILGKIDQTPQALDKKLLEWELDSLWHRIMELVDDKIALKEELRFWKYTVLEMRLKTPPTATKNLYELEDEEIAEFKKKLLLDKVFLTQMQRAIDAINKAFLLADYTLWPEILELMIYLAEATSFQNLELMSFIAYINFPVTFKEMNPELKQEFRALTNTWLITLVQEVYHFTTDGVARDMHRLISLQKSGYKFASEFIIGIIRRAVNPKKFPDQSLDIFNFHYNDDGHICGDANEILGLKS